MTDMWMPGAEQNPQPGGVTMNPSLPSRVTWHITWDALTNGQQPSFDGVAGYLERMAYCPHLIWDPWTGRIVQFYPADEGGRALVNWNQDGQYNIQIETFFSPGTVRDGVTYQTVADTPCVGLDRILAWTDSLGIPRVWPMGAPQWAGNSRDPGIWNTQAGHYGHCNVPDNTHTDPGPMPDLNGGITAQSGTVTPLEDEMPTPADLWNYPITIDGKDYPASDVLRYARLNAAQANEKAAAALTAVSGLLGTRLPAPDGSEKSYTLAEYITYGWLYGMNNGARTLGQTIKLADGTVTTLASLLSAIYAKPVATAASAPAAPAQLDVDALVARLKAELPAAVFAEVKAQINK